MTGTEFRNMCNDITEKELKRRKFVKKILKLAIGAWISLISMGELIYWTEPNWWSIPLGITFVLMIIGFVVSIIGAFMPKI